MKKAPPYFCSPKQQFAKIGKMKKTNDGIISIAIANEILR